MASPAWLIRRSAPNRLGNEVWGTPETKHGRRRWDPLRGRFKTAAVAQLRGRPEPTGSLSSDLSQPKTSAQSQSTDGVPRFLE